MKVIIVTILCLLFSFSFADNSSSSAAGGDVSTGCVTCQTIMQYVDSLLQSESINRDDIENALHSVCPSFQDVIDKSQCEAFIQQYGDSLLDLIMSDDGSTTTACVSVGLCDEDANGISYQILVPTYDADNTSMTFAVTENNIYASVFYYKIFLGGLSLFDWQQTSLNFNFSNFDGTSFSLFVLDPEGDENQYYAEGDDYENENTQFEIWSPSNNSWYYLTVNASFQGGDAAGTTGQYTLQITYGVSEPVVYDGYGDDGGDDDDEYRRHHMKKFLWIPVAVAIPLVCIICCCCCVRRRMRMRKSKSGCATTQTQEIPMQTAPTPMYFYVPPTSQPPSASVPQIPYYVTRPGQYSYVPMQPMVIPMTIPPTAPQFQQ